MVTGNVDLKKQVGIFANVSTWLNDASIFLCNPNDGTFSYLQSRAKFDGNLLDFTENLDLK